jgi:hypothetical protein
MSSHRTAVVRAVQAHKLKGRIASKARISVFAGTEKSVEARTLAADIERALADGRCDVLTIEAMQDLLAAVCRLYAAKVEAGEPILPCTTHHGLSATDTMISASGLLRAANLAVFELGMWQNCTGR